MWDNLKRGSNMNRNDAIRIIAAYKYAIISEQEKINILTDYWYIYEEESTKLNDELTYFLSKNEPENIEEYDVRFKELVIIGIMDRYRYFNNIYIKNELYKILNKKLSIIGNEREDLYTCPCCNFFTLKSRINYEICVICKWEDDGSEIDKMGKYSFPNHNYLNDYKKIFFSNVDVKTLNSKFIGKI